MRNESRRISSQREDWYSQISGQLPDPAAYEMFALYWNNSLFKKVKSVSIHATPEKLIWHLWENEENVLEIEQNPPDLEEAVKIALVLNEWYCGNQTISDVEFWYKKVFPGRAFKRSKKENG